jgi:hypothetical protein
MTKYDIWFVGNMLCRTHRLRTISHSQWQRNVSMVAQCAKWENLAAETSESVSAPSMFSCLSTGSELPPPAPIARSVKMHAISTDLLVLEYRPISTGKKKRGGGLQLAS